MYFISLEYGEWEDFRSKDVFVTADVDEACSMLTTLTERIRAICVEAQERFIYNGEQPFQAWSTSTDPLERIMAGVHEDTVTVVFSHMPTGKIADGREVFERKSVLVFHYDTVDTVPEIVDNDPQTRFEAMALPFERTEYGWRH